MVLIWQYGSMGIGSDLRTVWAVQVFVDRVDTVINEAVVQTDGV